MTLHESLEMVTLGVGAALVIAGTFYWLWVRAGRPRGVSQIERIVEAEVGAEEE